MEFSGHGDESLEPITKIMVLVIVVFQTKFIHFVWGVYSVCRFMCCVLFDHCVILCDVCYLCVVSNCSTTATG
jgi:hypothetical protein